MTLENSDIQYEKRDVDNHGLALMVIWMLAIIGVISVLMIPLTHYLWDLTRSSAPVPPIHSPAILLEVIPNQEYKKMCSQYETLKASASIDQAMQTVLEKCALEKKSES